MLYINQVKKSAFDSVCLVTHFIRNISSIFCTGPDSMNVEERQIFLCLLVRNAFFLQFLITLCAKTSNFVLIFVAWKDDL